MGRGWGGGDRRIERETVVVRRVLVHLVYVGGLLLIALVEVEVCSWFAEVHVVIVLAKVKVMIESCCSMQTIVVADDTTKCIVADSRRQWCEIKLCAFR
jgi:hypothetical protein